ncbi:MAG: leucyl aminopeptidase [Actinomycetes bacterium]
MPRPPATPSSSSDGADRRPHHAAGAGSTVPSVTLGRAVPASATAVAVPAFADRLTKVDGVRKAVLDRAGFAGRVGQTLVLDEGERARIVVGLGPAAELGTTALRKAGAAFTKALRGYRRAAFVLPDDLGDLDQAAAAAAVAEGVVLGGYRFDAYRSSATARRPATVTVVVDDARAARPAVDRGLAAADAVTFARNLVNEPGGSLTPAVFAEAMTERASAAGLSLEVLDADAIAAAGLGGIVAVNKGSVHPPRLVHLTYEPAEPLLDDGGDPVTVALVGKGITFDSGGLSLKPADGMMDMKCDMAGAAAVAAAMCALPASDVRVRVESWTPLTDNMTGGDAQRPGDVFTARNGRTVEVLNTDAEGRLVLADALCLATESKKAAVIDLATLTGACMVALGDKIAGILGNDDGLLVDVEEAAELAGERVWQLPLPADYRAQLDSSVADLKNIGTRFGGTLTAGLFLQEFVPAGTPWVHMDIAGPAFQAAEDGEHPKGATGFGVRTLLALLAGWGPDDDAADD